MAVGSLKPYLRCVVLSLSASAARSGCLLTSAYCLLLAAL